MISEEEYGIPLLILKESSPWGMVTGSDGTSFVLYDTGKIIYQKIENNELYLYLLVLSQDEINEYIEYLSIDESLYNLDNEIWAFRGSDSSSTILYLNIIKEKRIWVYGDIRQKTETRNATPSSFLDLYDKIINYRNENAIEWKPPKIEIRFWNYDSARIKRKWIRGFPDLNSASTINNRGYFYSVFIDGSKYERFINYYKEMLPYEAVEINGKNMSISYIIPFPNVVKINEGAVVYE
jgi:hypothetical protein